MEQINNFYDRSVALLAAQFQDAPLNVPRTNLKKLIYAVLTSAQDIQNQLVQLNTNRWLATAQGVQLDGLGQILGLARADGQSDDDYRQALEFQIYINTSSGTPENTIAAAKFFTKANTIWYSEIGPAAYLLVTDGLVFPTPPSDATAALQALSPAGVELISLCATYGELPLVCTSDENLAPLYVAPDPANLQTSEQLEVSTGNFLYVDSGNFAGPFGGCFAEDGNPIDTIGAGILIESLQVS